LLRLASENGAVLRKPPPVALLTGFNNGLNFQLLAWTHRSDTWPETASALRAAIDPRWETLASPSLTTTCAGA
jgi:small-conductance mechanosensitive channel